jgi:hypothetical protein
MRKSFFCFCIWQAEDHFHSSENPPLNLILAQLNPVSTNIIRLDEREEVSCYQM